MPWLAARLPRKKLKNCAVRSTSMKGPGDDLPECSHDSDSDDEQPVEFHFSERDARAGMGSGAFPVAGHCAGGDRGGCNESLAPVGDAVCDWSGNADSDVGRAARDFLVL